MSEAPTYEDVRRSRYDFISVAALPDAPVRPEDNIWAGVIFRGATTLLYGASGVGKTTFVRGVVWAVARGGDYCGHTGPPGGGVVAYLDYETAGGYRTARWKRVCGDDLSVATGVLVNDRHDLFQPESVIDALRGRGVILLVVDTLIRATLPKDENSNGEMTGIMDGFDLVARELNCAVLVITHQGKSDVRGFRGASAIGASPAVVLSFARAKSDGQSKDSNAVRYDLIVDKNRYGGDEPILLIRDGDGGYDLAPGAQGLGELRAAESAVLDVLRQAGKAVRRKDIVADTAARLVAEGGTGPSERTVERALDGLFERGMIRRPDRGLYESFGAGGQQ